MVPGQIQADVKFVFVSDFFVEEYVGGAELTSQAIIDSAPFPLLKLKSASVTRSLLEDGKDKFWIFGNFAGMDISLLPVIVSSGIKYAVLEYDYKYCKYRSPEKHAAIEGNPCNCENEAHGKLISTFFCGAQSIWWMSERQRNRYIAKIPELEQCNNTVLSSVFDDQFFVKVAQLNKKYADSPRDDKWIVLGSKSWVKGFDAAVEWCKSTGKDYEVVWNLPYDALLDRLARATGFVYLPLGGDTCPRMVIEAKLLGCELHLNESVEHAGEEWFTSPDRVDTESYLFLSRSRFWADTKSHMDRPRVSGYTTTYNCISQEYPFQACIQSMLGFCDEVCVVDGGSTDGTHEVLLRLAAEYATQDEITKEPILKLKVKQIKRDWDHPRHAVFDGLQKAEARKMCTGDFCWQQDSDEVVHEDDCEKIRDLVMRFPANAALLALPVIEYWGGLEKVRLDINPWKWRISRNDPAITHGIPRALRRTDSSGHTYAAQGTDGCDYIDSVTGDPIPFSSFYTPDIERLKYAAMTGNAAALANYEQWFNFVVDKIPGVFHFSWWDLERKIKTYRGYWARHWKSLFDVTVTDTPENNFMFDKKWSDVSDEDIRERAALMKSVLGGWVWHRKWDGKTSTPHISVNRSLPRDIIGWTKDREH